MSSLVACPRGILVDLGDVLLAWSANTSGAISAQTLQRILSTSIWHSYERGEITREVCFKVISDQFSLPVSEIAEAFSQARKSLQPNNDLVSFIRNLKQDNSIKLYVMSNIGKEDFEDLRGDLQLQLFDRVFTSTAAGMRKPDPEFYRYVLDQVGLVGSQCLCIDDKEENIQAAQTLGIRGLVYGPSTLDAMRQIFESPVGKGWRYLFRNAQRYPSETHTGVTYDDNFANLLIRETVKDRSLMNLDWGSKKRWNFFAGKPVIVVGGQLPDDLETTSLALRVLGPSPNESVSSMLDTMLTYLNDDGTFLVYYDRDRPRVDLMCTTTVLTCFYIYGRGHELERTLQAVRSMLLERSYLQGTRYYPSPDYCLGIIGSLVQSSDDSHLQAMLRPLLKLRVSERVGLGGSALDLAVRIITCRQMGVECESDRRALLDLQCEDGRWEGGCIYLFLKTMIEITNVGVVTSKAIEALSC
ncbi:HAD-like protein [Xylaria venustula]|nr:HAD-like protein [Xylaria venustula]